MNTETTFKVVEESTRKTLATYDNIIDAQAHVQEVADLFSAVVKVMLPYGDYLFI